MQMFCDFCKQENEVVVDKDTLTRNTPTKDTKAVCAECKTEQSINIYMIKSLVSIGKYYVKPRRESAFNFECLDCRRFQPINISKDQKAANCSVCDSEIEISPYMIRAMAAIK